MPTTREKDEMKQNKEIEKDIKTRRGLFSRNNPNKISKKQQDIKDEINEQNRNYNSALFGGYEKTIEQINNTELDPTMALEKRLEKINNKFKPIIGSNPMEFLNRIELDNKSNDPNEKQKHGKSGRMKKLEYMLKNSNGEFFLEEKDRFFRYEDYRLIDSYIPEVSKCLDLFRDCILSPDDLTKRSLNYYYNNSSISNDANPENKYILSNIEQLEKTYNIKKIIRTDIREACQLGDLFYLLMPYKVGFTKILKEDGVINDSLDVEPDLYGETLTEDIFSLDNDDDFQALFEDMISINENSKRSEDKKKIIENAKKDILDSINNNVKFYKDPTDILSEKKQLNKSKEISKLNINGSIFKKLPPENIVCLEIDNQILGYIYIEKNNINLQHDRQANRNSNPNSLRSGNTGSSINTSDSLGYGSNDVFNSRYDYLNRDQTQIKSKYALIASIFVKGISKKVNKDFLVKNQEFKELIYTLVHEEYILKKEVKMTFIEPQYIHHLKLSSTNIYGVSKISKSVFFCKIYLSHLLTNLMQKVIRGRDKRAFYIETGLDDDMEGTIQGFIKDIKSKELTSGHLKNITTILNSVGAFEDYYIPIVDGQRSVEIDTVPGMDVEMENEFTQMLLKSIITGMNVPYNYIDSTAEIDFARSLTMTNNPFVRAIINDQEEFGEFYSKVIRELYKNEFMQDTSGKKKRRKKDDISYLSINIENLELRFPTPIYLVLGNMNEQVQNAQQMTEFITTTYFPEDPTGQSIQDPYRNEIMKSKFKKELYKKHFLPSLEWDAFDEIYELINQEDVNDSIEKNINFAPEAKKKNELDMLEEDDF